MDVRMLLLQSLHGTISTSLAHFLARMQKHTEPYLCRKLWIFGGQELNYRLAPPTLDLIKARILVFVLEQTQSQAVSLTDLLRYLFRVLQHASGLEILFHESQLGRQDAPKKGMIPIIIPPNHRKPTPNMSEAVKKAPNRTHE